VQTKLENIVCKTKDSKTILFHYLKLHFLLKLS